jgi:hypothetical protein
MDRKSCLARLARRKVGIRQRVPDPILPAIPARNIQQIRCSHPLVMLVVKPPTLSHVPLANGVRRGWLHSQTQNAHYQPGWQ